MEIEVVNVFTLDGAGGNPCPVALDADGATSAEMQATARAYGHESCFVQSPSGAEADAAFRFWVPNHEMEMCGHATIGTLWLMAMRGRLPSARMRVETLSGPVAGFITPEPDGAEVEITQPAGRAWRAPDAAAARVRAVLGVDAADLADAPIQNAVTSRTKTLVPLRDPETLHALTPDFSAIEDLCAEIGSTGLYPYAPRPDALDAYEARQFPRAAGYPEDAATGVAAAALAFGLLEIGALGPERPAIEVFQGRAMGRPSRIVTRLGFAGARAIGCLLGGAVALA